MKKLIVLTTCTLLCGCARFGTNQVQYDTFNTNGEIVSRRTETTASSFTFFDSKSALATFKASQSDKTQSATVGGLTQEASGSNAVNMVDAVVQAAVSAAVKAVVPKP